MPEALPWGKTISIVLFQRDPNFSGPDFSFLCPLLINCEISMPIAPQ